VLVAIEDAWAARFRRAARCGGGFGRCFGDDQPLVDDGAHLPGETLALLGLDGGVYGRPTPSRSFCMLRVKAQDLLGAHGVRFSDVGVVERQ
jgi:hypothetical protein